MSAVTTIIDNTFIKVSWISPNNNGAMITQYMILIREKDATTYSESTYCDGS